MLLALKYILCLADLSQQNMPNLKIIEFQLLKTSPTSQVLYSFVLKYNLMTLNQLNIWPT